MLVGTSALIIQILLVEQVKTSIWQRQMLQTSRFSICIVHFVSETLTHL